MSQPESKADFAAHGAVSRSANALADGPSTAKASLEQELQARLRDIDNAGLRRDLKTLNGVQGAKITFGHRRVSLFCSNNYLGLAEHPEVIAAAKRALVDYGASAVSSRLISGHMKPHEAFEEKIAAWKGSDRALLFSTGYQANVGVITTLLRPGDLVLSDALNHASIIDGCRLSRAEVSVFRHNDVDHLEELLRENRGRRTLIVTESVFSMDGDHAPLKRIVELAEQYDAWTMVDEAHAVGVFGPTGAGLVQELGLDKRIDVHVGTLGKALASFGAYVAGSGKLVDLLINQARPFVFTTGLPPSAVAAASAAVTLVQNDPSRGARLLERARSFGLALRERGLTIPHVESQILPVLIGDATDAVSVAEKLLDRDIYVAAIRPPTVPRGTSRLRVSLMATHSDEQLTAAETAIVRSIGELSS